MHRPLLRFLERTFVITALLMYCDPLLPLLRNQFVDGGDPIAGDRFQQITWMLIHSITVIYLLPFIWQVLRLSLTNVAMCLLVVLAIVSMLWSDVPEVTVRRSVALVGTSLFGLYLARRYTPHEIIRLLAWALGGAAIVSVVFALAVPSLGVMGEPHPGAWRGVFIHKNALGRYMTVGVVVFVLRAMQRTKHREIYLIFAGLCTVLVLLSESRTAYVTLPLVLLMIPLAKPLRWRINKGLLVLVPVAIVCVAIMCWVAFEIQTMLELLSHEETLVGRTRLWALVLHAISDRPLLGYGFGAFWLGWDGASAQILAAYPRSWEPPHGHNGLLDLWIDLGIVGVVLLLVSLTVLFVRSILYLRRTRGQVGLWPLCFCAMFVLFNITQSVVLEQNNIVWVLFVATSVMVSPLAAAKFQVVRAQRWRPRRTRRALILPLPQTAGGEGGYGP